MKRTLVVDWLDKYGGAERVITALHNLFAFSNIYTLVNIMQPKDLEKICQKNTVPIHATKLQFFKKKFRILFFLFHRQISLLKIDSSVDTIISSSHSVAKGVKKSRPDQLHISYFQARNFKYIWEEAPLYFGKALPLVKPLLYLLQKIDKKQAQQPDYIIANSLFVQRWIKKIYNRESKVIYPPVDLEKFPLHKEKEDYYVAVGRIVAYKRFDLIVQTFNKIGKKLIVVGDGEELYKLKSIAKENIFFTGFVDSHSVCKYISKAKAFIHIGIEDFGIAPIEAQSCGTPIIAYRAGGVLETVQDQITGLFFPQQTVESLENAIHIFEKKQWNYQEIHQHAQNFSQQRFFQEMKAFVNQCENKHFKNRR